MTATKVIMLKPRIGSEGYVEVTWELGKERNNPNGKIDVVTEITVYTEPKIFVGITYRDFGEEWVLQHLSFYKH